MRKILETVAVAALLLGLMCCSFDNPVDTHPLASSIAPAQAFQPFALPRAVGMRKAVLVQANVTVANGGTLAFWHENGAFSMNIRLTFGPGAVASDMVLDMIADDEILAASFGPEGLQFLKPGDLSIQATGLDLGGMDAATLEAKLKLLYQNDATGAWEQIPAARFTADPETGSVTCVGGVINHFSRYGFGL